MAVIQRLPAPAPGVRPLPFPFRGALSLSFDADCLGFAFFEALMRLLNTRGPTPLGPGLGLETTSSLFFYSQRREHFSYFSGLGPDAPRCAEADRLDDYLRAGWIDANHAFGDFSPRGGFVRAHALRAYETLAALGATLPVFTNHGPANNVQNVAPETPWRTWQRGDAPGHPAYHADLFPGAGVRFVWADSMINELAPPGALARLRALARQGRHALGPRQLRARRLSFPCALADGTRVRGFFRFRSTGEPPPALGNLGRQLAQVPWDALYARRGCVVVYQHPGVLEKTAGRVVPCGVQAVAARARELLAPLRFLAREREAGRLWVCGLARLLLYGELLASVRLRRLGPGEVELCGGDPALAPRERFQGLTVYDRSGRGLRLWCAGRELATVRNPADETGAASVSVPLVPLEDIWS